MSKTLVIFGATGQQGASVVNYVLQDPQLSREFKIRAVTRDPSKSAAQALRQRGAEVVKGDLEDRESIKLALQGAHTVFSITVTVFDDQLRPRELAQGKAIADAAVAAGAQFLIFSTLPHMGKISGGKFKHTDYLDVKADIEEYIRTLPIKSAFIAPGSFMQNLGTAMPIHPVGDGTYSIFNIITPQSKIPLIDVVADTGKYVGAILAEPDKYEGKVFCAATTLLSYEEIAKAISQATGKTVKYSQVPVEVFRGFMRPASADYVIDFFQYVQDFGLFGPQSEELVAWAGENARGNLTTLEEFLAKNPVLLQ